ncbi:MAG: WYL domain-containing protein [Bacteroidota bacterium]
MAYTDNLSRLSRLTSLLLKLQARPYISVDELAEEFDVSRRTIYRDLGALEAAGVPLTNEKGKGFAIMRGYHIPPVMFTEAEANAIIFGEKLIDRTKDESLIQAFCEAVEKIKAVLYDDFKERVELLGRRTIIGKNWQNERSSNYLSQIQEALTHFRVLRIHYHKEEAAQSSQREVEPFAIYHNQEENWVMIAWCRMRKDFRSFRIDRIKKLYATNESFPPHKMTMEEYVESQRKRHFGQSDTHA